jgi:beta-glucosidase
VLVPYDQRAADDAAASDRGSGKPQFEFGSGLAYTTFEYSGLTTAAATSGPAGATDVSVTVRNTGSRAGADVVQLYVSPPAGSGTAYVRRLRRFAKLTLAAGESRPVHFKLARDEAPAGSIVRIGSLTKPRA